MGKRGPQQSTGRGRAAGAKECRAWLSAAEFAALTQEAERRGVTTGDVVRASVLAIVGEVSQ